MSLCCPLQDHMQGEMKDKEHHVQNLIQEMQQLLASKTAEEVSCHCEIHDAILTSEGP